MEQVKIKRISQISGLEVPCYFARITNMFSLKKVLRVLLAWSGLVLTVPAGTVTVDFSTKAGTAADGATPPEGWRYTSIGVSDGVAYFNSAAGPDSVTSPTFPYAISNIVLECKCSSTNATRFLQVVPLIVGPEVTTTNSDNAVALSVNSAQKGMQLVTFKVADGVNAFLIRMTGSGSTGTWNLYSAAISHTGPDPLAAVANLRAEQVTATSFVAAWDSASGAESYGLRVWQVNEEAPTGSSYLLFEEFSAAANFGGNPVPLDDGTKGYDVPGWSGSSVYAPTNSQGLVQIGTGKATGWLLSPELPSSNGEEATVVIRAKRYAKNDEGTRMPIDLVRGTETNTVGVFSLNDSWGYYAAPLGPLQTGDQLLLHSITNGSGKRAWIESMQVLTGYVRGTILTNEVLVIDGLVTGGQAVGNLDSGNYWFAVRADAAGEDGVWSSPVEVVIESTQNPGAGDDGPTATETPLLTVTHVTEESLAVVWSECTSAKGYLVEASTNAIAPAREGDILWRETFPRVSQSGNSSELHLSALNLMTDSQNWSGTNIYYCTTADHAVQLGNTSGRGTLETGSLGLDGMGRVLKFTAWCSEGRNMPLEVMGGGRTNLATDIVLGKSAVQYLVPLPDMSPGDRVVFHSTTNAQRGRTYLGEMSILADYSPANTTRVVFVDQQQVTDCAFALEGLATTTVFLRVGAIYGGMTNWSEISEIDLGRPLSTGAWRVTEFQNGEKRAGFDIVKDIKKATPWTNGVTIPGFYLFKGSDEISSIGWDSGKAYMAGGYASSANDLENGHSLSLLGSSGSDVTLELRIFNDSPAGKVLSGAKVSFLAYQWTFPEGGAGKELEVSWAVTEQTSVHPMDSVWTTVDSVSLMAVASPGEEETYLVESKNLSIDSIDVPPGGMLWLRWHVAKEANSPMLGVGDVRVRIEFRKQPTVIHFR